MQETMTHRQRSYIQHLIDTRACPEQAASGETPGWGNWSLGLQVANERLPMTKRQASTLITWLLARPEIEEGTK